MAESQHFLGLHGYEPQQYEAMPALVEGDAKAMRALKGRAVTRTWSVWEAADDTWFADAPVVIEVGPVSLELAAFKTHLCVSWNQIDVNVPPDWGDGFDLAWREGAIPELDLLVGKAIRRVAALEYRGEVNGVILQTDAVYAEVFNALDELGVRAAPDDDPELKVTEV